MPITNKIDNVDEEYDIIVVGGILFTYLLPNPL